MTRYKSKVDAWLAAIAIGPGILVVPVMLFATRVDGRIDATSVLLAALVLLFAIAVPLWVFASTSYEVTRESLIVRCGPVRNTIPLDSIRAIKPSRSMSSAPALSLDRLELELDSGRKLLISPDDRSGFLSALARAGVSAAERVPSS
jgi:hypothetical protein